MNSVQRNRAFPIVGIGSSAGGVEACITLLKALPTNLRMAFVFVAHLDPSRESALRDIFARSTGMPVLEIKQATVAEPSHVYLIPPNCDLTISDGVLNISDREQPRQVNTAIDIFFRSLAADQASNAIGIVLSGTGADGTLGLGAIKGTGGLTFAQDSSAKYESMPSSATLAGVVDFVLPPEGIAKELEKIAHHKHVAGAEKGIETFSDGKSQTGDMNMAQIFAILRRSTRVDFSEYKPPTIGRRVARRMALHKIEKLSEYVSLLMHDRNEVTSLYQDLLINVTSFFRDPAAFDALKRVVYPELLLNRKDSSVPIRMWVPGCSTGEEAYSHAITLLEFLSDQQIEVPIQIFGTDLSEAAIHQARTGIFKDTIEADVSAVRLRRYFHRVESGYQISKAIRDRCIFSTQNVFNDPPFSRIDLISCRNVMIYLGQSLQRRVIPIFHYALNPSGFLMIGNTEGLLGAGAELFDMTEKQQKIYRKRAVPSPVSFGYSVPAVEPHVERETSIPLKPQEPTRVPADVQREADRLLLARYAPPSVLVNEQLDIIQTKGHTSAFLELPTGKASLNLLKMARPGLLFELQSAIDEARKSGVDAKRVDVHVESNGGSLITIRVTPFKTPFQDKTSFLIAFEAPADVDSGRSAELPTPLSEDERTLKDKQIAQLKQELAASKDYLQAIIEALEATNEELQSANEEIQSGNEELQSTNEELQTSKEELESANEELHTVNEEMQHRNDQLTQLNNDLNNLLNSVNLPMVMVGPDLSVRRFTPQASKALGLTATDVGRPITRLKLRLEVNNLEQRMLDVIAQLQPKQYQLKDVDGKSYDLRISPYRTTDNRIEGVVLSILTFEDLLRMENRTSSTDGASPQKKKVAKEKSKQHS